MTINGVDPKDFGAELKTGIHSWHARAGYANVARKKPDKLYLDSANPWHERNYSTVCDHWD